MTERRKKIEYVKPEILDLGPAAVAHGATCSVGSMNAPGDCTGGGIADGGYVHRSRVGGDGGRLHRRRF